MKHVLLILNSLVNLTTVRLSSYPQETYPKLFM